MGQGFYQNLSFSFLGKIFQYYLLGLKACWLRFASFGIRAQVLKSIFLSLYLLFLVIILSCSFGVLYSLFLFCTCTKLTKVKKRKKKEKKRKESRDVRKEKKRKENKKLFVVSVLSNQNIVSFVLFLWFIISVIFSCCQYWFNTTSWISWSSLFVLWRIEKGSYEWKKARKCETNIGKKPI